MARITTITGLNVNVPTRMLRFARAYAEKFIRDLDLRCKTSKQVRAAQKARAFANDVWMDADMEIARRLALRH